jgi:hypothetical protein
MRRIRGGRLLWALALPAVLLAGGATAQTLSGVAGGTVETAEPTFWTPHRLANAVALPLSLPAGYEPAPLAAALASTAPTGAAGGPGRPPSVFAPPQDDDLVTAPVDLDQPQASATPDASFGHGVFTQSRVIPPSPGQTAAAVDGYPYSTAGRLFFHDPRTGQDFVCGAAVAASSYRAILTAGQCVVHGSSVAGQRYNYSNFMFIPAYDNGAAPYGKWSTDYYFVSNAWLYSGVLPNPRDYALLEAVDQGGKTLGSVVGSLGWQTYRLSFNHFTTLAYPSNLDAGVLMQRNDAQTSGSGGNRTWIQGSDMGSGVQGGPWIQDFGLQPAGAPKVNPFGPNIAVGVSSYGGTGYIGASQLDSTFASMRSAFCAHQAGNC